MQTVLKSHLINFTHHVKSTCSLTVPDNFSLEVARTNSFSIFKVYVSLALAGCSVLTKLNIPAEFSVKLALSSRMFPRWSNHVTLGLGNHLVAVAVRELSENLNVGSEKAERRRRESQNHEPMFLWG